MLKVTTATASGSNPFGGTTYPCTSHSGAESDSDRDYYSSGEDAFALEEMCERALEAAIPHVPTLGWSRSALEAGCIDLDLPPGLHSTAMPHGPVNLVLYFYESRNHRLADILAKWRKEEPGPDGKNYEIAKANRFVKDFFHIYIYIDRGWLISELKEMSIPPYLRGYFNTLIV